MWGAAQMGVVYANGTNNTIERSSLKGTITIEVRDCDGQPIGGVHLVVDPEPEALVYQGATGLDLDARDTESTYASAVAFNSATGPVHITAMKTGVVFDEITIDVSPDLAMDMAVVRGH